MPSPVSLDADQKEMYEKQTEGSIPPEQMKKTQISESHLALQKRMNLKLPWKF